VHRTRSQFRDEFWLGACRTNGRLAKSQEARGTINQTAVYIDGYNLYYGRLRGTPFKCLDPVALFEHILHAQDPASVLRQVRFYTAPALPKFASHGDASMHAQNEYHRALKGRHPDRFEIVLGSTTTRRTEPHCPPTSRTNRSTRRTQSRCGASSRKRRTLIWRLGCTAMRLRAFFAAGFVLQRFGCGASDESTARGFSAVDPGSRHAGSATKRRSRAAS
jgi:hypothetical protein